ncbi:pyridoxal phosphate-dependent transferase [Phlyctochytrium arcticum]|nr:pyridoxal phosphate-dependent transferase [Phlyctochytrium arcticum]
MLTSLDLFCSTRRIDQSLIRTTPTPPSPPLIDFSSNDYLGLAHSPTLHTQFLAALTESSTSISGSTGSRLLNGNSARALDLERFLAEFHGSEAALLFNSGYDANISLLSTLPQPNGGVVYDEFVHASMHDGIKLGRAKHVESFKHNDVGALRKVLRRLLDEQGEDGGPRCQTVVVAVEALYSMDGDLAPLLEILNVIDEFSGRAVLIVDEAHSTGVYGSAGRGLVSQLHLEDRVFLRLNTFGKAAGSHGAVVLCSQTVRDYLVNYARPLVYSTMMPHHGLVSIRCSYDYLITHADRLQKEMQASVALFRARIGTLPAGLTLLESETMIQGIIVPGNAQVVKIAKLVQSRGFDVKPIRSPTVPKGTERLRVCIHSHNTRAEILDLVAAIQWALSSLATESPFPQSQYSKL